MQKWLADIQSADEQTKRRWLIILSTAAMIIVIAIWIVFVTGVIRPSPAVEAGVDEGTNVPVSTTPPFFQQIADGAASFYHSLSTSIGGFFQTLGSSKTYHVTP